MKHEVMRQMQQDRIEGNVERHPDSRLYQEYQSLNAKNMVPDLPRSSHIMIIDGPSKGEIHPWTPFFAKRPDMCTNCDVNGNTDPTAWRQFSAATPVNQPINMISPTNNPYQFDGFISGEVPGHVPQVQNAPQVLGIDANFTQDFTDPVLVKAALPLPKESQNEVVADKVKEMFNSFI